VRQTFKLGAVTKNLTFQQSKHPLLDCHLSTPASFLPPFIIIATNLLVIPIFGIIPTISLRGAEFSRSAQLSWSRNSASFLEPEVPLPSSQKTDSSPCPEPDELIYILTPCLRTILILCSHLLVVFPRDFGIFN